jgi:hypothetical protein
MSELIPLQVFDSAQPKIADVWIGGHSWCFRFRPKRGIPSRIANICSDTGGFIG